MDKKIEFITYGDIEPTKIEWLYYPYIAKGKVTLLCGDPGIGKTTFILSLIAKLTTEDCMPFSNQKNESMNIMFQSAEDGAADTIIPRLMAMNADCKKVIAVKGKIDFIQMCDNLKNDIIDKNVKLIVFDPIQAFIGGVNISAANEVRSVMERLTDFAEETNCAILLIGHLNKNTNGINALYRSLGSIDIVANARSVLMVAVNPNNPDNKIMIQLKNNLAKCGKSIVFDLENGAVKWIGLSDVKATDLSSGDNVNAFKNACDLLTEYLQKEDTESREIMDMAAQLGIGITTLKKAKSYLGIKSIKKGKVWYYKKIEISESDI